MTGHILHKVCAQNSCSHKISGQDSQGQEQEQTDAVTTSALDNFCCYLCDISHFFTIHWFGDALLRQTFPTFSPSTGLEMPYSGRHFPLFPPSTGLEMPYSGRHFPLFPHPLVCRCLTQADISHFFPIHWFGDALLRQTFPAFSPIHWFGDALLRQTFPAFSPSTGLQMPYSGRQSRACFFMAAALFLETCGQGACPAVLAVSPLAHK